MIALGALVYRLWFGPLRGRPTILSKINTAAQLLYLAAVMMGAAAAFPPYGVRRALALIALSTTVLSGLNYVQSFTRRAWLAVAASEGRAKQDDLQVEAGKDAKRTA